MPPFGFNINPRAYNIKAAKGKDMQTIYNFLKKAKVYYLATCEGVQPRVRPFGTINLFEDKLYIMTSKAKTVSRQLHENPKIEISAYVKDRWLRLEASLVEDSRQAPRDSMLNAYPELEAVFPRDDENTELWFLRNASAGIYELGKDTEIHKF